MSSFAELQLLPMTEFSSNIFLRLLYKNVSQIPPLMFFRHKKSLLVEHIYYRRATRGGWRRGGGLHCSFLKIEKKCPDFGKKGPYCVHPWVEYAIQNIVLRVSRRKSSKMFPWGVFFLVYLTKSLLTCPNSIKPPLPWKISSCAPAKKGTKKDKTINISSLK